MRFTYVSIIAIMFVVIAVAIAGCSSTGPAAPSTGGAPSGGSSTPAGSSAPAAGSVVSGANIFGGATSYNWMEYKMSTSGMTIYTKYEKSGKCTMRMEGKDLPGGSMTQDCSSTGGQAQQVQNNPSKVSSDVTYTFTGIEPVSVPAGTYPTASKYTSIYKGVTSTFWTAPGVPGFVKMVAGDVTMELNGWG